MCVLRSVNSEIKLFYTLMRSFLCFLLLLNGMECNNNNNNNNNNVMVQNFNERP